MLVVKGQNGTACLQHELLLVCRTYLNIFIILNILNILCLTLANFYNLFYII